MLFRAVAILSLATTMSAAVAPPHPLEAENTDGLGGAPSLDVAKSWPGIVFEQTGARPAEAIEAIVHFESIEGNLDVRQHRFSLLVFREDDYWNNLPHFHTVPLGALQDVVYDCGGSHCVPNDGLAVGTTGETNGDETTYRVRWDLPASNPLTAPGRYVVIFLATHGESEYGGVKLNFAEAREGNHDALPIPVFSVEGNVQNQSPRRIAFSQDPTEISIGFAFVIGSSAQIFPGQPDLPRLDVWIEEGAMLTLGFETRDGVDYELQASRDLVAWSTIMSISGDGERFEFAERQTLQRRFFRILVDCL